MSVTLAQPLVSDAEDIARYVLVPALRSQAPFKVTLPQFETGPRADRDKVVLWYADALRHTIQQGGSRCLKACAPDGTLVGFCSWVFEEPGQVKLESNQPGPDVGYGPGSGRAWLPASIDLEAWRALTGALSTEIHDAAERLGRLCRVSYMAVAPAHQRKGLGSTMLRRILEDADGDRRTAYAIVSSTGLRLFLKAGFRYEMAIKTHKGGLLSMARDVVTAR